MNTIPLAMLTPLLAAPLVMLTGKRPNVREAVSILAGIILLVLVSPLTNAVLDGARPSFELWDIMPGIPLKMIIDPLGILFVNLAAFLWIITIIYAIGYMRGHNEANQTRFYAFFAVSIFMVIGLAFSGNLMTLFIFYEGLTLSTFPLVTHAGNKQAKKGGRVYLGLLMLTSMLFFLLAIIATYVLSGTVEFTAGGILAGKASPMTLSILLALYVFGVGKAGIMPFHRWLPAAMVAPTPVSALLHAVAVVKAGVFTILKVVVYIFGLDLVSSLPAADLLLYIAAFTTLAGSFIAMRQDNLKRRLAYSTISQLSYIIIGALLANRYGIIGGGMHMVMHAFGKITLFFGAGAILVASHKTQVSQLKGIGRAMPITMIAFLIGSLSVIGLPPLGGTWSKWFLLLGVLEADKLILLGVLLLSSILNIAYLLPISFQAFFSDPNYVVRHGEAPIACRMAMTVTALACVILFAFPGPLEDLLLTLFG
ncbi:MAG: monovalent cation/H+ antiporter subunit D family protein [Magnetococcales bacterium]|nr:monovalent cation/H+ antiporter subunit D family protein [Magnetococcales bacterium]